MDLSKTSTNHTLTDDWPFLYLRPTTVDIPYLLVIAEVLGLSIYAGRKLLFGSKDAAHWQMFFLGGGFLLIELQAIARLSLIYGSTWLTTSVVINGVLIMILLANLLVIKISSLAKANHSVLYSFLFASLLASYFLPTEQIFANGAYGASIPNGLITIVTLLPMFAAAIIFATAFARTKNAGMSLGFNMLGAVLGGMLEYLSNFSGIKSLLLVALILYLCSWLCAQRTVKEVSQGLS